MNKLSKDLTCLILSKTDTRTHLSAMETCNFLRQCVLTRVAWPSDASLRIADPSEFALAKRLPSDEICIDPVHPVQLFTLIEPAARDIQFDTGAMLLPCMGIMRFAWNCQCTEEKEVSNCITRFFSKLRNSPVWHRVPHTVWINKGYAGQLMADCIADRIRVVDPHIKFHILNMRPVCSFRTDDVHIRRPKSTLGPPICMKMYASPIEEDES